VKARTYIHARYPWRAIVQVGGPAASYYAELISQGLKYGLPAKRFGRLGAILAIRGTPRSVLALGGRTGTRGAAPEIDRVVDELQARWGDVRARLTSVPDDPSELFALGLHRSAGLTVFFVNGSGAPVLVAKVPREGNQGIAVEESALKRVEGIGVAPLLVGSFADVVIQEGVPGEPSALVPLSPDDVCEVPWSAEHRAIADALTRLASHSVTLHHADELDPWLDEVDRNDDLSRGIRSSVSSAAAAIRGAGISVLRHGDTSVQNCLTRNGSLAALVDWERAQHRGVPGFDTLNFALAWLDHSLGLRRWSESLSFEAFDRAWDSSPLMRSARAAARAAATAAGLGDSVLDPMEVTFFARRLGRRLADPDAYATGSRVAARMLERVCAL